MRIVYKTNKDSKVMTMISLDLPRGIIGEKLTIESMENNKSFLKELFTRDGTKADKEYYEKYDKYDPNNKKDYE